MSHYPNQSPNDPRYQQQQLPRGYTGAGAQPHYSQYNPSSGYNSQQVRRMTKFNLSVYAIIILYISMLKLHN
jgi:hypothetical protein